MYTWFPHSLCGYFRFSIIISLILACCQCSCIIYLHDYSRFLFRRSSSVAFLFSLLCLFYDILPNAMHFWAALGKLDITHVIKHGFSTTSSGWLVGCVCVARPQIENYTPKPTHMVIHELHMVEVYPRGVRLFHENY